MTFAKTIRPALTEALTAAKAAHRITDPSGINARFRGTAEARLAAGSVSVDMSTGNGDISNHGRLELEHKLKLLEAAMIRAVRVLEEAFPGRQITYRVSALDNKHALVLDSQDIIDAVVGTWAKHFRDISCLYGQDASEGFWLIDSECRGHHGNVYSASSIIPGSDLTHALLRCSYSHMTLAERKTGDLRRRHAYGAARLFPAVEPEASAPAECDQSAIETAWKTLLHSVHSLPWDFNSRFTYHLTFSVDQEDHDMSEANLHNLLHPQDRAYALETIASVKGACQTFADQLRALAPNTPFTVELNLNEFNRTALCRVGLDAHVDAADIAITVAAHEAVGARPMTTYAVRRDSQVLIVSARSPSEAVSLAPTPYVGSNPVVEVWRVEPITRADCIAANDALEERWSARHLEPA